MVRYVLSSTGDRIKNNVRDLTPMVNQTSYSRHFSTKSVNGKTRKIIHVSIRPQKYQNPTVEVDLIINFFLLSDFII
jgi:hypothetical protein